MNNAGGMNMLFNPFGMNNINNANVKKNPFNQDVSIFIERMYLKKIEEFPMLSDQINSEYKLSNQAGMVPNIGGGASYYY